MTTRFPRIAFLLALCGLIMLSYVASSFPALPKDSARLAVALSGHEGGRRANPEREHPPTQTDAPDRSDEDAIWQSASRIATTTGSNFQCGKQHARAAMLAHHRVSALTGDAHVHELRDVSRDQSPLHSIPLLI